jgi:hypothetical protein
VDMIIDSLDDLDNDKTTSTRCGTATSVSLLNVLPRVFNLPCSNHVAVVYPLL